MAATRKVPPTRVAWSGPKDRVCDECAGPLMQRDPVYLHWRGYEAIHEWCAARVAGVLPSYAHLGGDGGPLGKGADNEQTG